MSATGIACFISQQQDTLSYNPSRHSQRTSPQQIERKKEPRRSLVPKYKKSSRKIKRKHLQGDYRSLFLVENAKNSSASSSSSSYSTSPSSSSFVTVQSLRNIQIVLLPGSSEGDFFQALSLSSILAAGLHESRTWPISLDREPTKPRNST
jgi:hypothetical protein